MTDSLGPTVAVIGGGLAGLAAGCALTDAGFRVTVLERKPYVGGRASSYQHPGTGEIVDNCQHVLLGCCTGLLDFYGRIGADKLVRWYDRLNFIEPGGRASVIEPSWLLAPLHTAPSFLRAHFLGFADKLAITRALLALMMGLPVDDGRSFLDWLRAHSQTERAIERFWKVVLVSALNEDLDRVAIPVAAMVFRESFLKSARGGAMGVPRVPLTELYSKAADYIAARGGKIEFRATVEELEPIAGNPVASGAMTWASRAGVKLCVNQAPRMFQYAVCAVPFDALARIVPQTPDSESLRNCLTQFETSPITGVHLWFDREITTLDHAVLLDRTIQWMFQKSRILDRYARPEQGADDSYTSSADQAKSYIELVISASKDLVEKSRQEIVDLSVRELAEFFPVVSAARLVKATVVKEVHATYSPLPGSERYRPNSATCWPQVFLAGDWTATGWPATMEGAVRSGYLAAEALCQSAGRDQRFMPPELGATGLMRLFNPR